MAEFQINSRVHGTFTILVDDEDWDRVSQYNWSMSKATSHYYRVETRSKNKLIRLHRFILNVIDPKIKIDHINHNTCDNRKSNLRICTQTQNMMNCRKRKNKTGYTGVYQNHKIGKYRACISIRDKTFHIFGNFDTAEEAAKARDDFALSIRGEYAVLNFKERR